MDNKRRKINDDSKGIKKRLRSNSENDIYYKINERKNNDEYFRSQNKDKQIEILNKEDEIYNYFNSNTPIRYKILFSSLPIYTKSQIIHKIDMYESMPDDNLEYIKLTKWYEGLSRIPFDNYINMPISIKDKDSIIQDFLANSYKILCNTIYGQNNAKNKIMQILAQWITNPNSLGQIIAIEGPPGVGKTTLIKNGVSLALNRPFSFYALGGASDISDLEGHSYTYEGANWGRMIEMLMESKVMNPIIFFDELDKVSKSTRGNEINGLLTHLTDPAQNNIFHDKYFPEIDIDFSKVLFFFSFNDINLINPVLKDRLTIVKFEKYTIEDKIYILKDYIIPKILENIGFQKNDIIININTIKYIIQNYTHEEPGVRNIKRIIEDLFLKINLLKLIKENTDFINVKYKIENLTFPLILTIEIICNLLK
jgi:ATP-dependent Lon protease